MSDTRIIYDGDCGICQRSIRFVQHRSQNIAFIPFQSERFSRECLDIPREAARRSVIYADDSNCYANEQALCRIFYSMRGCYARIGDWISRPILRDIVYIAYRIIANHRHWISAILFGKRCFTDNDQQNKK